MNTGQIEKLIEPPLQPINTGIAINTLDILKAYQRIRKCGLSCKKQLKQYLRGQHDS